MENVVKEESKNKNIIIGVLVFVIVLLLAALVYFVFIKKDEPQKTVKPQDNQQVDNNQTNHDVIVINNNEVKQISLGETNKIVRINNKDIKLKAIDGRIYFNDKIVKDYNGYYEWDINSFEVFVTEKIILIHELGEQCSAIFIGAIDENGNFVEVKNDEYYYVSGLFIKDGTIMGTGSICSNEEELPEFNIKLLYDGNTITIKKMN